MGWGNNNPRNPKAPCPDPNKHCNDVPGANIDDWVWQISGIAVALMIAYLLIYHKKRIMNFIELFVTGEIIGFVLVFMFVMFKKSKNIQTEFIPLFKENENGEQYYFKDDKWIKCGEVTINSLWHEWIFSDNTHGYYDDEGFLLYGNNIKINKP